MNYYIRYHIGERLYWLAEKDPKHSSIISYPCDSELDLPYDQVVSMSKTISKFHNDQLILHKLYEKKQEEFILKNPSLYRRILNKIDKFR